MSSKVNREYAFTGATGCRNRGVEALIMTAITEIRARDAGAHFHVISTDPDYDASIAGPSIQIIKDFPGYYRMSQTKRAIRYGFGTRTPGGVRKIRAVISGADVIIATGGDIFSSDYGVDFLRRNLAVLREAQAGDKKTVFFAHSIGPFRTKAEVELIKPVLNESALVTVRESFTRDYLINELNLAPERIVLTADVAFLMQPPAEARIDVLKRVIGLPQGKPYIVLAPSEGITSFATSEGISDHDEAWLAVIKQLLDTTDSDIVLLPHVQDLNVKNDDTRIIGRLLETIGASPRIHAAFGPYSAMDYKGIIKGADLLIGERMHACIAGLSQNVPTLSIGYSVKAAGIMADLLGDEVNKRQLLIAVQDFRAGEKLSFSIADVWETRAVIRGLLAASTPAIKARAAENFRLLAEV